MDTKLKIIHAMTYDYPCIDERGSEECTKDSCYECASELLNKFEKEIIHSTLNAIIELAHCEDADCFECAFGSAEKCLLKED